MVAASSLPPARPPRHEGRRLVKRLAVDACTAGPSDGAHLCRCSPELAVAVRGRPRPPSRNTDAPPILRGRAVRHDHPVSARLAPGSLDLRLEITKRDARVQIRPM